MSEVQHGYTGSRGETTTVLVNQIVVLVLRKVRVCEEPDLIKTTITRPRLHLGITAGGFRLEGVEAEP